MRGLERSGLGGGGDIGARARGLAKETLAANGVKERRARRGAATVPGGRRGGDGVGIDAVATRARAKEKGWVLKDEYSR